MQKAKSFASNYRPSKMDFSKKEEIDPLVAVVMKFCEKTKPFENQKGLHIKAIREICSKGWQKPIYDETTG